MALLQKGDRMQSGENSVWENIPSAKKARAPRGAEQALKSCRTFLQEYFPGLAACPLAVHGEEVFLPTVPALPQALRIVRNGVWAGSAAKGRFAPAHHLFMAYGAQCENIEQLTQDDARCAAWLRGEAIPAQTAAPGWTAVLVDGFPLGFGKQSGGVVKNHYPKGLRNLG